MTNNEILSFYQENGYYVENIFSADVMDEFREEGNRLIELRKTSEEDDNTRPYAYTHKDSELFDKLWRHPRTLQILETLIGGKVDGLQTWMYFKPPGELGRDVHQNIFYSHANRGDIINASCAIDDSDEENGCLYVYPGSQVESCLPINIDEDRLLTNPDDWRNERGKPCHIPGEWVDGVWTDRYEKIYLPMNSGDVIFLHSHVIHGSETNKSETKWRRAALGSYLRQDAHFNPGGQMKRERINLYD